MDGMAMFEMANKKGSDPGVAQSIGEASFSDDSLGITSGVSSEEKWAKWIDIRSSGKYKSAS